MMCIGHLSMLRLSIAEYTYYRFRTHFFSTEVAKDGRNVVSHHQVAIFKIDRAIRNARVINR